MTYEGVGETSGLADALTLSGVRVQSVGFETGSTSVHSRESGNPAFLVLGRTDNESIQLNWIKL